MNDGDTYHFKFTNGYKRGSRDPLSVSTHWVFWILWGLYLCPGILTWTLKGKSHDCFILFTLWLFNIAVENGPFIDGLPIKNGDFPWLCYSRGLKSEQFSWMWTNRLRKSRHDRVTAGSQQSIKTQGDCLHLKDTKYHYNKHERAHPSHCRLLFCQHCFALQTIILPQWFDLRRSKTEWTKETMKREEATVCEKEREEDKKRNKQRTQMKTSAENTTEQPPERPPNDPPNDPWFMSCQAQDPGPSLTTTWSAELPAPPHPFNY